MENPAKSATEIARIQVLDLEDRVWEQAVRVEELRASGASIEADEQLLASLREQLRKEQYQLRQMGTMQRTGEALAAMPG